MLILYALVLPGLVLATVSILNWLSLRKVSPLAALTLAVAWGALLYGVAVKSGPTALAVTLAALAVALAGAWVVAQAHIRRLIGIIHDLTCPVHGALKPRAEWTPSKTGGDAR